MSSKVTSELLTLLNCSIAEDINDCLLTIRDGNTTGDGHLAEMLYLSVKPYNSENYYDLAIKQRFGVKDPDMDNFVKMSYQNEIHFYKEIVPTLETFQDENNVERIDSIAKCYATISESGKEKIVLENLKAQGYQLYDKRKAFDKAHLVLVFQTYGRFHGTSLAFSRKAKDAFSVVLDPLLNVTKVMLSSDRIRRVADIADDSVSQEDVDRLQKFLDDGRQRAAEGSNSLVLAHGDCWSNNFMFKYDEENNPIAMKMLDFQMCRRGSPAQDLSHFFYLSLLREELNNIGSYLKIYHDSLTARLNEFGLSSDEIYSFEQLKQDWLDLAGYGITMSVYVSNLKFSYGYTSDDPEEFLISESILKWDHEGYKTYINYLFKHILETNYLHKLLK